MVADVYSREIRTKVLPNKQPEAVNAAMRALLPALVEDKTDFALKTDKGREFARLEDVGIPEQAVHRENQSTNDIAVIDRAMQTIKTDQAAIVADGDASNWKEALPIAEEAYNKRHHSAVYGAPQDVERIPEIDFRILQSNAR